MLIIVVMLVVLLVGLFIQRFGNYNVRSAGEILTAIGVVCLVAALVALLVCHVDYGAKIKGYEVLKCEIETIEIKNHASVQIDALIVKAIEGNQWLEESLYYKTNPWTNVFVPNKISRIERIDILTLKSVL